MSRMERAMDEVRMAIRRSLVVGVLVRPGESILGR